MSVKEVYNNILYYLGLTDEPPTVEKDEYEPYSVKHEQKSKGKVINIHQGIKNKMIVFHPESFDDVRDICDEIKNRRAAIVNLERLDKEEAKRVLDFMMGSTYALNGNVKKVGNGIFVFAPDNIDVAGTDFTEEQGQHLSSLSDYER